MWARLWRNFQILAESENSYNLVEDNLTMWIQCHKYINSYLNPKFTYTKLHEYNNQNSLYTRTSKLAKPVTLKANKKILYIHWKVIEKYLIMKTCSLNIAKQIEKFANTVSHWVIIFKCSGPVNNMGVRGANPYPYNWKTTYNFLFSQNLTTISPSHPWTQSSMNSTTHRQKMVIWGLKLWNCGWECENTLFNLRLVESANMESVDTKLMDLKGWCI